jgi:phosphatidate cytidylyltransferase
MEKSLLKSNFFLRLPMAIILTTIAYYSVFHPLLFYSLLGVITGLMGYEWWMICESTPFFMVLKRYLFLSLGLLYIGTGSVCGLSLWHQGGPFIILWVLSTACGADILAYCVGKIIKGPKLCPAISPGKTWSGAIGGIAGGTFVGVSWFFWGNPSFLFSVERMFPFIRKESLFSVEILCLGICITSVIGDLLESWAKRQCEVKDSSSFIPGHGGILDRMDSILPCMIVMKLLTFFCN